MYKILWVLGAAVWHSSRTISSNAPVLVGENLHNKFQIHVCLCSMVVLDGSQHVIEGSQVG